jgi:hypothetical protein
LNFKVLILIKFNNYDYLVSIEQETGSTL